MIYEGTISYEGISKKGNVKTFKEKYLIEDALTFTEAEDVLNAKFGEYDSLDVTSLKRSRIKEVVNKGNENERLFIATLTDVFTDENGNEKEIAYDIAFFSINMETAHTFINIYTQQGYCMELKSLKCAPFIDVIRYGTINGY